MQFNGKSRTLQHLVGCRPNLVVPDFVVLPVSLWMNDRAHALHLCDARFGKCTLAVRSDAWAEDRPEHSMAGTYASRLAVQPDELPQAIDQVVQSMPGHAQDAVMVQIMLSDIQVAGVASTHRIADGAPWYCIEMAPLDTAAVTSGRANGRQYALARSAVGKTEVSAEVHQVLALLLEVEAELQCPLEIEFALAPDSNSSGQRCAHLLQARVLSTAARWVRPPSAALLPRLDMLQAPDEGAQIVGERTVLSLMADWNPAELLGSHPRPLALSLFQHLIANGVWWQARAQLGYASVPTPQVNLLRVLGGRPWVDVRRSANSLLPMELDSALRAELVNTWVQRLIECPDLHDKVEFEIFYTARDFSAATQMRQTHGLSSLAWGTWDQALRRITHNMMQLDDAGPLSTYRAVIAGLQDQCLDGLSRPALLSLCQRGTLAFSSVARMAFIADAQLRSAVRRGALRPERAAALKVAAGSAWAIYEPGSVHGHLRPGTFDITQQTWAASQFKPMTRLAHSVAPFVLRADEARAVKGLLAEVGLECDAQNWIHFVQQSSQARERAKHVFTRHLSVFMDSLIADYADLDLDGENLSWLTLAQLEQPLAHWPACVQEARAVHEAEQAVIVSPVLSWASDRYLADSLGVLPNFVGRHVRQGRLVRLRDASARQDHTLRDCIVVLSQADPGFDWLFDCHIAGLITAWGGANSHMAIRCAEFDVTAAIGCGEAVLAYAAKAQSARIDPLAGALWLT